MRRSTMLQKSSQGVGLVLSFSGWFTETYEMQLARLKWEQNLVVASSSYWSYICKGP